MADTSSTINVSRSRLFRVTLNVRITGMRGFGVRLWVAVLLLRSAARVLGCGINIDTELQERA